MDKTQTDLPPINILFSLRAKLVAVMLFASLAAALAVGGTAYRLLMRDFDARMREHAFANFEVDMEAYLGQYGSWDNARRSESFQEFVLRRKRELGLPPAPDKALEPSGPAGRPDAGPPDGPPAIRRQGPPFRFLLIDPQGRVLLSNGNFREGQVVGLDIRALAHPIRVNGKVEVMAVPLGNPQLTPRDRAYIEIVRKALWEGVLAAIVQAVALGMLLGSYFGSRVRELTNAIRSMSADGELLQQVPVRSRDEMGLLATTFNHMSSELAEAHTELKRRNEQIRLQAEQLRELSIRDPLTNLLNRRHFDERAAQLYLQAVRHRRPLSLMVGDLDLFKQINDNFSHAVGDEVLRRVAGLLQHKCRSSDVVARYGGEEFVVAFVESTAAQAALRCEELRRSIEEHPWHELAPGLRVTMSMGLSDDTGLGNVEKMLAAADARLYEAKHGGRNRVCT
ncbi:MAG TPA: diguanylate cyclase [Parasulfuritortus sp.]